MFWWRTEKKMKDDNELDRYNTEGERWMAFMWCNQISIFQGKQLLKFVSKNRHHRKLIIAKL